MFCSLRGRSVFNIKSVAVLNIFPLWKSVFVHEEVTVATVSEYFLLKKKVPLVTFFLLEEIVNRYSNLKFNVTSIA